MISNNKYLTQGEMESNAKEIYTYLSDKGWTINAISGLLGNMQRESTINPGLWQSLKEGNYSGGYGLVQWTPATKYTNWAKANGYDIGDGTVQLYWIDQLSESTGEWIKTSAYNLTWSQFKTSTETPEYLASAYTSAFTCSGLNNSTDANLLYVELGAKDTTATSQPAPAPAKPSDESWKGNVNYYLESEEVRKWQHAMNVGFDLKGDDALKEDGKFGADSQAFAKNHNLWSGQKHHCPTAIKWLRRTLHDVYSFTKLDTDYGKWTSYLSKCVKVFQKNRGLTQDAYVGLLTTYRLLKG